MCLERTRDKLLLLLLLGCMYLGQKLLENSNLSHLAFTRADTYGIGPEQVCVPRQSFQGSEIFQKRNINFEATRCGHCMCETSFFTFISTQ